MATAEIGALRVTLAMNAGEFTRGARQAETVMDRLSSRARSLGLALGGAFVVGQFASWATGALKAAGDAEAALATVEAIIKSTGGAAGMTSEKLVAMAQNLKALTNIDDDKIMREVTANLLTFTNVVGPVFREAQVAAINLSAVLRQDLQSSTIQLGKALNDPIKGITALRRVGVAFTESQREQIKVLMESGNILDAQRIILRELAKEFGGAAEAQANTIEGRLNKVMIAFGDALEDVGKAMDRAGFLDLAQSVSGLAGSFKTLSPEMQTIIVVTGGVTAALLALGAVVGTIALIFGSFAIPFAAAAIAIGAAAGTIIAYWATIKAAAITVKDAFAGIYEAAKTWLLDKLMPIIDAVSGAFNRMANAVGSIWDGFKKMAGMDNPWAAVVEDVKAANEAVAAEQDRAATAAADAGPDQAEKLAMANVQAAAQAEAAAHRQIEATKLAQAEQKKLAEQGKHLAEQIRTPTEIMVDSQTKLTAALDAGKISAERYGLAMQQAAFVSMNAYASMASGIASSLQQAFGKSKAVAIAVALINTYESVTKALAAYPPPWNYAAAAAALAAGLAQVANIRKTTSSGGGGGGGSVSGGAAAANPNAGGGGGRRQGRPVRGL